MDKPEKLNLSRHILENFNTIEKALKILKKRKKGHNKTV